MLPPGEHRVNIEWIKDFVSSNQTQTFPALFPCWIHIDGGINGENLDQEKMFKWLFKAIFGELNVVDTDDVTRL